MYLSAIVATIMSSTADSGTSLMADTRSLNMSGVMRTSLRLCCSEMPYTWRVSMEWGSYVGSICKTQYLPPFLPRSISSASAS